MDDVQYDYCLYGPNGQCERLEKPEAAGGVTNICKHCGNRLPPPEVPDMEPF